MNRNTKRTLFVCSIGLTLALASCGSDGSEDLTSGQFREQATAICTTAGQQIGVTVAGIFDGPEPTPDELQTGLDTIVELSTKQLDDIAALDAPSSMDADVTSFVAEGRAATARAEAQGLAFWGNDADPWADMKQMAISLGLDSCGSEA
ncbi:MAG: hypothetical protein ABW122_05525 [Ilumatobacteraceae bacterium]